MPLNALQVASPWPCAVLLICLSLVVSGCDGSRGPRRVSVSGAVSIDGQALESGTIRFLPTGNNTGPAVSGLIHSGEYHLNGESGPVPGEYRVAIVKSVIPAGGKLTDSTSRESQRVEWSDVAHVPDQNAHQQNFKLSVSDPPIQ